MDEKTTLISDLDDTIWDWVKMWFETFSDYLFEINKITKIDIETLKQAFRKLHTKYGTTEVSYAYKELDVLTNKQIKLLEDSEILHRYNSNKKNFLQLYTGTINTLEELRKKKIKIIGFTESSDFYTRYRIKTLELDGYFESIYTPQSHDLPESVLRYYPKNYWTLKETKVIRLDKKFKKPDEEILNSIVDSLNVDKKEVVYVGDKLDRDILMANKCGITSVHAVYGNDIHSKEYELLKEVTHWTDEEVEREESFKKKIKGISIEPDYTIHCYDKILELFKWRKK